MYEIVTFDTAFSSIIFLCGNAAIPTLNSMKVINLFSLYFCFHQTDLKVWICKMLSL